MIVNDIIPPQKMNFVCKCNSFIFRVALFKGKTTYAHKELKINLLLQ